MSTRSTIWLIDIHIYRDMKDDWIHVALNDHSIRITPTRRLIRRWLHQ